MNAWETLAADCDQAIQKCSWCHRFGHDMPECPDYVQWHASAQLPIQKPGIFQSYKDLIKAFVATFLSGGIFIILLIWRFTR